MFKKFKTGLLLAGVIAAQSTASELVIEEFAPDTSVFIVSLDELTQLHDRLMDSSAKDMLTSRIDEQEDAFLEDLDTPLKDMLDSFDEDMDLSSLLGSMRAGFAISVEEDPESFVMMPQVTGFVDFGEHGAMLEPYIFDQIDELRKQGEVEEVEVAGRDCILVPGQGLGGPGGMGFEPDFSAFSDMDTYLLHEDEVILIASSAGGMRRAIEAMDGDPPGDALSGNPSWKGITGTLDMQGPRVVLLTEHLSDFVSVVFPNPMFGMMGSMFVAMIGEIDAVGLGVEAGEYPSLIDHRAALWMPEGKSGIVSLVSENQERESSPAFFDSGFVSVGHLNVDFGGVVDWIKGIIRSNPMLQAQGMQAFQQFEPMLTSLMDSMGSSVNMVTAVSRPIEPDSLHNIWAIECRDTQRFNDAFASLAADLGMEQRDFQGHIIYEMPSGGMMPGVMGGGDGVPTAIALGGEHVFIGDIAGVEVCLRNVGTRMEMKLPPELAVGMEQLPGRELTYWSVVDLAGSNIIQAEIDNLDMQRVLSELAEDDPEMAEDMRAEYRDGMKEWMETLDEMNSAFGPLVMYCWSTEDAYIMAGSVMEAVTEKPE